jgi:hypothetical protein
VDQDGAELCSIFGVKRRIILKWIFTKWDVGYGLD